MTDPDHPPRVDDQPAQPAMPPPPVHIRRRHFSFVWIIPILAAVIAIYLGYRTIIEQGPLVTITFNTAQGLAAGQTQIKYKAVALGTVESIDLSPDNDHVVVRVRMNNLGTRFLTNHARFWVVRPRFSVTNLSGLDTLVSGAFIGIDPGSKGGHYETHFKGLEEPPGVRSDVPGSTYVLRADSIGSISSGSPVFYRDVVVGEVLGYDLGDGIGPVTVNIFVRAPYNKLVKPQSHFWDSSGLSLGFQNGGFHVEVQSLEALLAGGVTFDLPPDAIDAAASPNNATFHLFDNKADADSAGYSHKVPAVAYFQSSVSGISRGTPVTIFGMQVGEVTNVKLLINPTTGAARVRVALELQPERVFSDSDFPKNLDPMVVLQHMVDAGLRISIASSNFITGQKELALTIEPQSPHVQLTKEGDAILLPNSDGSGDPLTALSTITAKLSAIPFSEIGQNLNKLLVTANGTLGGDDVKKAIASLSTTLQSVQTLVDNTNRGLQPTLKQLPVMTANLNATLREANQTLGQFSRSYGGNSDFSRSVGQLLSQADGALRSVKELTDYLDRHPEALILGRTGRATGGQ
ncbi:MCE family protein [Acidisoma cellulosilytica]|uniref:MCE family protein n=1 Tax=Acidisoma cellulosilyticum TaxID=2802395 RepID=A0A964E2J0_9PROT|nr:MlaD family protein [Acidisoma cellulosilyticum]MCB8879660.1 MCE family protein [Acidisoma cellulosilyticum]